ncbi:MAG: hypothetical protein WC916_03750 [Candidatus Woesearchaeota archaeon]
MNKQPALNIAFDLDDVLFPLLPNFIEWHNRTYHTTLQLSDFYIYDWAQVLGCSREESIHRYFAFHKQVSKEIEPVVNAFESVNVLKNQGHRLFIITARQHELEESTRQILASHLHLFEKIIFTNAYPRDGTPQRSKADICIQEKVDVIIDDSAKTAKHCSEKGIRVLLFDFNKSYLWNKHITHPLITRVHNHQEVLLEVQKIYEEKFPK